MSQNSVLILGVRVDSTTLQEVLDWLHKKIIKKGKKRIIFTPNPEIVVQANQDQSFKAILNSSDINIPDGLGLGLPVVRGRELFESALRLTISKRKVKVFLMGSSRSVIAKSLHKIKDAGIVEAKGVAGPWINSTGETDS